MQNLLLLKFDCFLRANLARFRRHFAACELLPGYLYGVNLLNSTSAQANSAAELKVFACAFLRMRSNLRARAGFAPLKFDVFLRPAQI